APPTSPTGPAWRSSMRAWSSPAPRRSGKPGISSGRTLPGIRSCRLRLPQRGDEIVRIEDEAEQQRDVPERVLLVPFLARCLPVLDGGHGLPNGGAEQAAPLHIHHAAR